MGSTGAAGDGAGEPAGSEGKLGHEKFGKLGRLGSDGSDGIGISTLVMSSTALAVSSSPKRSQKSRVEKVDCAATCCDEMTAKLNNAKKTDDLMNAILLVVGSLRSFELN